MTLPCQLLGQALAAAMLPRHAMHFKPLTLIPSSSHHSKLKHLAWKHKARKFLAGSYQGSAKPSQKTASKAFALALQGLGPKSRAGNTQSRQYPKPCTPESQPHQFHKTKNADRNTTTESHGCFGWSLLCTNGIAAAAAGPVARSACKPGLKFSPTRPAVTPSLADACDQVPWFKKITRFCSDANDLSNGLEAETL